MKQQTRNIIVVTCVYVLLIVLYSYFTYQNTRSELLDSVDQRLLTAAHATHIILGKNFHDELSGPTSISAERDFELAVTLNQFKQEIGVAYVYSLKKFGEKIRFVVSSATDEELANNAYEASYYTTYQDMDPALQRVFDKGEPEFAEYSDRWGEFRSVFVPFDNTQGERYVIGADVSIDIVKAVMVRSMAFTFMLSCFIGVLLIPLVLIFLRSSEREWQARYASLFCDHLTGLPNRNQLIKDLDAAKRPHLALIDISKFRDISNTHGPSIGDEVLKQFACCLNSFVYPKLSDYKAYRINGDVFATMVDQKISDQEVNDGTLGLIEHLTNRDYLIDNQETVRLGVTVGGVHQKEDALMLANMALDEAKRRNIQTFVYNGDKQFLPKIYKKNLRLKALLEQALQEDRLVPFFQPIVDPNSLKPVKYECLARIVNHMGEVELTPDVFLPVARRVRIYPEITRIIVTKAIAVAKKYRTMISVNISISDILNYPTALFIIETLKKSGVAELIQFEILETEAITDRRKVLDFVKKVKKTGAQIGVDDFGRSYSNFDRVVFLPVDFIKIDQSIIAYIEHNKQAQKITKHIVAMAHKHKIQVVAEYCHNEATTMMAANLGVDQLQGFYLGKPAPEIQVFTMDVKLKQAAH
ncbi:EAL domain-containing protein [Marinicella sp. W31]|uniref:EAL domain-containing protein n=1 Tax=Marinicella sp. W31 TaxID=3023713 RepID=UPI003757471F